MIEESHDLRKILDQNVTVAGPDNSAVFYDARVDDIEYFFRPDEDTPDDLKNVKFTIEWSAQVTEKLR